MLLRGVELIELPPDGPFFPVEIVLHRVCHGLQLFIHLVLKLEAVVVGVEHHKGEQSGAQESGDCQQNAVSGAQPFFGPKQTELDEGAEEEDEEEDHNEPKNGGRGYGQGVSSEAIRLHQAADNPFFHSFRATLRCRSCLSGPTAFSLIAGNLCALSLIIFRRLAPGRRLRVRRLDLARHAGVGEANGLRIECVVGAYQADFGGHGGAAQSCDVDLSFAVSFLQAAKVDDRVPQPPLKDHGAVAPGYKDGLEAGSQKGVSKGRYELLDAAPSIKN